MAKKKEVKNYAIKVADGKFTFNYKIILFFGWNFLAYIMKKSGKFSFFGVFTVKHCKLYTLC